MGIFGKNAKDGAVWRPAEMGCSEALINCTSNKSVQKARDFFPFFNFGCLSTT